MLICPSCQGDDLDRGTLTVAPPEVAIRCVTCGHEWIRKPAAPGGSAAAQSGSGTSQRMSKDDFKAWLEDPDSLAPGDIRAFRRDDPAHLEPLQRLAGLRLGPASLSLLNVLISRHIPRYGATERESWTLTALPSTNRKARHQRLFTLSVSNVEVAWSGFDPKADEDTGGVLYVAESALAKGTERRLRRTYGQGVAIYGASHNYEAQDEASVTFESLEQAERLLQDDQLSRALRHRTLHLMQSGQVPGMFQRFHNAALAAKVMPGRSS